MMLPINGGLVGIAAGGLIGNSNSMLGGSSQVETMRHAQSDVLKASSLNDQMNPRLSNHAESPNGSKISMRGDAAQTIGELRRATAL